MNIYDFFMDNLFLEKLKSAVQNRIPFVLFRRPTGKEVELYIHQNAGNFRFLMHSFDAKTEKYISTANRLTMAVSEFDFDKKLELHPAENIRIITQSAYEKQIKNAIKTIQETNIRKLVFSRIKPIKNKGFSPFKSFANLLTQHPNALVYLWHNPGEETWIGATPELLLHQNENQIETVSLAGTKLPEAEWTLKELDEQTFVTDFILDNIKSLRNIKITEPETIQAGKFQHLKTYISAEIEDLTQTKSLLESLHPTPAVCGLPKKAAFDFIIENEGYGRGFYTGYLGIETPKNREYFVNLRSAQWHNDFIAIYVGGGITADSNPTKEWEETELKSGTIINALV